MAEKEEFTSGVFEGGDTYVQCQSSKEIKGTFKCTINFRRVGVPIPIDGIEDIYTADTWLFHVHTGKEKRRIPIGSRTVTDFTFEFPKTPEKAKYRCSVYIPEGHTRKTLDCGLIE